MQRPVARFAGSVTPRRTRACTSDFSTRNRCAQVEREPLDHLGAQAFFALPREDARLGDSLIDLAQRLCLLGWQAGHGGATGNNARSPRARPSTRASTRARLASPPSLVRPCRHSETVTTDAGVFVIVTGPEHSGVQAQLDAEREHPRSRLRGLDRRADRACEQPGRVDYRYAPTEQGPHGDPVLHQGSVPLRNL